MERLKNIIFFFFKEMPQFYLNLEKNDRTVSTIGFECQSNMIIEIKYHIFSNTIHFKRCHLGVCTWREEVIYISQFGSLGPPVYLSSFSDDL